MFSVSLVHTSRRTVHSLVPLLARYKYIKLVLVAPVGLDLPTHIYEEVYTLLDCEV